VVAARVGRNATLHRCQDRISYANIGFGNALHRFLNPFAVTPWGTTDNQSP
jgi:hypothetical protein